MNDIDNFQPEPKDIHIRFGEQVRTYLILGWTIMDPYGLEPVVYVDGALRPAVHVGAWTPVHG